GRGPRQRPPDRDRGSPAERVEPQGQRDGLGTIPAHVRVRRRGRGQAPCDHAGFHPVRRPLGARDPPAVHADPAGAEPRHVAARHREGRRTRDGELRCDRRERRMESRRPVPASGRRGARRDQRSDRRPHGGRRRDRLDAREDRSRNERRGPESMTMHYLARSRNAFVVLASALVAACAPQAGEQTVEFRVPVTVEEVGVATLEDRIVTTGTLRTPEIVTLSALDTGVLEINRGPSGYRYAEGDLVRAGDEVARIVGEDVRIAARMAAAQRSYEAARAELEANRDLLERGLINQTAFNNVASAFEDA